MNETLKRLHFIIEQARHLDPADRQQLLDLTSRLEKELSAFSKTHSDEALRISQQAEKATASHLQKSDSDDEEDSLFEKAKDELMHSAQEFKASHPELTTTVQHIVNTLSNLGI